VVQLSKEALVLESLHQIVLRVLVLLIEYVCNKQILFVQMDLGMEIHVFLQVLVVVHLGILSMELFVLHQLLHNALLEQFINLQLVLH
jgi:hypothetical protein